MEDPIKKVESAIKSEPWYVWAGAAGAAGIVVYYVWKRKQASTTATATTGTPASQTAADAAQLNGYTVDSMAGLPFGADSASGYNYQGGPMANTGSFAEVGVNGSNVPIIPYGETPIFDSNGNLIGYQQPNPTTSPNPAPGPSITIRQKATTGPDASSDANRAGIPFHSTPNAGSDIGAIPFGDVLQAIGPEVQGGSNNPSLGSAGTTLWWPVKFGSTSGYVSAYDVQNSNPGAISNPSYIASPSATGHGGGGDSGGFHLPINAGRATMDQWTFSNGMHQDFDSLAMVGE